MIRNFTGRVLQLLDGIYDFVGSQSRVDQMDLGPVALVHDVSAQAEYAAGFFCQRFEANVIAAGLTEGFVDQTMEEIMASGGIADAMRERGLGLADVDVWVLEMWESVTDATAANFDTGYCGLQTAALPGGAAKVLIRQFGSGGSGHMDAAGPTFFPADAMSVTNLLPIRLGRGSETAVGLLWRAISGAGGGCTWNAHAYLWIGPAGARPPAWQ